MTESIQTLIGYLVGFAIALRVFVWHAKKLRQYEMEKRERTRYRRGAE